MQMQPKAALALAGRPMGQWVLQAVREIEPQETIVVVGHQAELVKEAFGPGCRFALQRPQLGTAHAVLCCEKALQTFVGDLLVVNADHPLISPQDLERLISHHRDCQAKATLLTWQRNSPSCYGRILRDEKGRVAGIVEARDATLEQLALREINLGLYCFSAPLIFDLLRSIRPDNVQREYYLTDVIGLLARRGEPVEGVEAEHLETGFGINTPEELARAEAFLLRGEPLE